MTNTNVAPCAPWATRDDLPDECDQAALTPGIIDQGLLFASTILFNLTRRRWRGLCTDTYRPFSDGCWACYGHEAGDVDHDALMLPATHVRSVTSVIIDGTPVDPATYQLRDRRFLWRILDSDGQGITSWPCWQDFHRNAGAANTFEVTYTYGQAPPADMIRACARLGYEFAVGWTPDCAARCKLPRNVTSMTRGGITTTFANPAELFERGKTGLADVDMLVSAVNLGEAKQRPTVTVPGRGRNSSRT